MLNFYAIDPTMDLRSNLSQLGEDPRFAWLHPILHSTLADATSSFLNANSPERLAYDPADTERLLSEAGSRMKFLTDLEREIQVAESHAMLMALDYALTDSLRESDFRLAKLRLKADRRMGNADESDPSEVEMSHRYDTVVAAFNLKLALHNLPNGSLNFGEQVILMRDKFVHEIRSVYEILLTVRVGAATSFNIDTPLLPGWDTDQNLCYALDAWCLALSDEFEKNKRSEVVFDVYFSLCEDRCCSLTSEQLMRMFREEENFCIDFDINFTAGDTKLNFLGVATGFYRLIAAGACVQVGDPTMELDEKEAQWKKDYAVTAASAEFSMTNALIAAKANRRESVSLIAKIRLPDQEYMAIGDPVGRDVIPIFMPMWHRPEIRLGALPVWEQGTVAQAVNFSSVRQVRNANPFGRWRIWIDNRYLSRRGGGTLKSLQEDAHLKLNISDIVIGLRIAITASK